MLEEATAKLEEEIPAQAQTGSNLYRKATLLIAEILHTANRVLPLSIAAKIQALPRVFTLAANYAQGDGRVIGTVTLSAIDSYNRHRMRLQPATVKDTGRPRYFSISLFLSFSSLNYPLGQTLLRMLFDVGRSKWSRRRLSKACKWTTKPSRCSS
jgi:hypothetical protein